MNENHLHALRDLQNDVTFGYVARTQGGPRRYNPRLVLNGDGTTVEHAIIEELRHCDRFTFSVAFVTAAALARLKQHLLDFSGEGRIITSDFLGFNQPQAFAELMALCDHTGIDVRLHSSEAFHPKGYIFEREESLTAMIGSSNLTQAALSSNHEWNLRVSAAGGSDLADQLRGLLDEGVEESAPLTQDWIDQYAAAYVAPPRRPFVAPTPGQDQAGAPDEPTITPNAMQQDALMQIDFARAEGANRAIIISATGTGKTMLSALDVQLVNPDRMLFVAHREQILDRTIDEFKRALGGSDSDYGKLTGGHKQSDRRFVFATIQTLAQQSALSQLAPDAFDYIIVDEAHRAGADTYKRVIDHFEPEFLLGMTATPERTDGFNVFELFNYVVPYEIRLNHALDAGMLSPFHYYGIADVTFEDGTTTSEETELRLLITPERVRHIVDALETYGQAGVDPRGIIFCSRKNEAHALADALNDLELRGKPLRTVALTGDDPVALREQRVAELEAGELDYILTVDVFNEGIDIPSLNQIVMLRQTQSPIVFVQQLGRGLRLAEDKDYLVVIDFIGNYANNFLIPVALFGDQSLNRESLREQVNETVEGGSLPGLSSVSFDEISRERVLASITQNELDSEANLKNELQAMKNRTGGVPMLWDFHRFESVDPVLLATKKRNYPTLAEALLGEASGISENGHNYLALLSGEALAAKRPNECLLLERLLERESIPLAEVGELLAAHGLSGREVDVRSTVDSLALRGFRQSDVDVYVCGVAEESGEYVKLTSDFRAELAGSSSFKCAVGDLIKTGLALNATRYEPDRPFTPGMQYSRRDAARIAGWTRRADSTVYGYKTDVELGVCTIFVTLNKSDDIEASTAYKDALLDRTSMRWFSRNKRTLQSPEVVPIVSGAVTLHVFVKKDDSNKKDKGHYYLGTASAHDAMETTMPGSGGKQLPVVTMTLRFDEPISQGLFDYFGPDGVV